MWCQEVWPGPMEGVGRREFVLAASALQLTARWMTPFIRLTKSVPSKRKLFEPVCAYLDSGLPVTVQLMGDDPDVLGKCGALLLQHPAVEGINLNCGCPSSRVIRHNTGGGMLRDPGQLAEFCCRIAEYLPGGKLSVKIRSGWEDPADMRIFLPQLAASGAVSKIFFHYRTVSEFYRESALPERFVRIKEAVEHCGDLPLIANGDIFSPQDGSELCDTTGASGVMIARPWMRDPFLLRRFIFADEPEPEKGREIFFETLRNSGIRGGALIELGKMLWGVENPRFKQIIAEEYH